MHLSFNTNSINLFFFSWPHLYYTRKREHDKRKFKIFSRKREHARRVHLVLTKKTRSAAAGAHDRVHQTSSTAHDQKGLALYETGAHVYRKTLKMSTKTLCDFQIDLDSTKFLRIFDIEKEHQ